MESKYAAKRFNDLLYMNNGAVGGADAILVNLNSLFSTVYYQSIIDEYAMDETGLMLDKYVKDLSEGIKSFILKYASRKIVFYYTEGRGMPHSKIYKDWRIEKSKAIASSVIGGKIFGYFYSIIKELKKEGNVVDLVETSYEGCLFVRSFINATSNSYKTVVISRDIMDFLNLDKKIKVWDGNYLYEGMDKLMKHTGKKIPQMHYGVIKYYLLIKGEKKLSYDGIKGYGPKKTLSHIYKNIKQLSNKTDELIKWNTREYELFNLDLLMMKYNIIQSELLTTVSY